MAGFSIEGNRWSALWANRGDVPGEPVFVYIHDQDGTPGLVSLSYMAAIAYDLHIGDREDWGYRQLFVMLPEQEEIRPCTVGLAGTKDKPKMTVSLDESPGVAFTLGVI